MKPSFQTSSVCPENCHSAASAPTGGRARALPGEIHRAAASSQDFQGSGSPAEFHRRATRTVWLADTGTCGPLAVLPRSPARCHRLSAAGGRPPPACHAHLRKPTNGGTPGFVGGEHTTDTNRAGHAGLRRTDADHDYGTVSDPGGPRFGGIRDTHSDGDLIRASRRRRHASTTEARWLLDDGGGAALRRIRRRRLQSVLVGLLKVMPVNPHSLGDKGEFTDIWSAARSGDSEHRPVSRPVADPAVRAFQRSVSSRSEGEQCPSYECSWSMTTKWCGEG